MPADYNVIDQFLNAYLAAINSGFGLLRPDVMNVFGILIVITIGITAVFWALDENNAIVAGLFRKVLLIGFFAWLLNDWSGLTSTIVKGFAALGLKAGGSAMSVQAFLSSPSDLVYMGMKLVTGMTIQIKELTGPIAFFENFALILVLGIAVLGVIIAFVVLAVQVFVTIIEFRLVTLAAFVLIPFGIIKQTSFLSERALGYVASSGLKLLTIALIVSVGSKTFQTLTLAPVPSVENAISILIASVVLVMLSLTVPAIASALVTGGPQLGAGAALAGTAGVAAGVGGAYLAGRGAMGAAGAVAGAPGAIASKAKAAAGQTLGKGFDRASASLGGGGGQQGGMQPPNPSGGGSPNGGGAGAASAAAGTPRASAGTSAPTGDGSAARGASAAQAPGTSAAAAQGGIPKPPTPQMASAAQSIAAQRGIEAPNMNDGNAVRQFLDRNTDKQLGTYDRNGSAGSSASSDAATTGNAASAASADGGSAAPAPSSAPPASETVRRAAARRRINPTNHAQTAMAATSAQGGAGMTATIESEQG